MRLRAAVVAIAFVAATTFMHIGPASAQSAPTCADFPTQIDMPNSARSCPTGF